MLFKKIKNNIKILVLLSPLFLSVSLVAATDNQSVVTLISNLLLLDDSNAGTDPIVDPNPVTGLAGINGIITIEEYNNITEKHSGVVSSTVANGEAKRGTKKASGKYPNRHLNGKISFSLGCGADVTRILIRAMDGRVTPVTPCGSELTIDEKSQFSDWAKFEFSKISPNGKMIAAEVGYLNSGWTYSTIVYELTNTNEVGREVARFANFAAPEWLPNNKLMLIAWRGGTGLYVTDSNIKNLSRIDNNQIHVPINNADVSPSGKQVVFEYNQQIWIMGMQGQKMEPLIVSGSYLRFPTWSPDGRYIAFLLTDARGNYHNEIQFYELASKEVFSISTDGIFAPSTYGSYPDPSGPLSWINKL